MSIRRHRYQQLTLADEIRLGTLTPGAADFLAAAVRARRNLLVAGATADLPVVLIGRRGQR